MVNSVHVHTRLWRPASVAAWPRVLLERLQQTPDLIRDSGINGLSNDTTKHQSLSTPHPSGLPFQIKHAESVHLTTRTCDVRTGQQPRSRCHPASSLRMPEFTVLAGAKGARSSATRRKWPRPRLRTLPLDISGLCTARGKAEVPHQAQSAQSGSRSRPQSHLRRLLVSDKARPCCNVASAKAMLSAHSLLRDIIGPALGETRNSWLIARELRLTHSRCGTKSLNASTLRLSQVEERADYSGTSGRQAA